MNVIAVQRMENGGFGCEGCRYNDWFPPSKDELLELYNQKDSVGGFSSNFYRSSSEFVSGLAWRRDFSNGGQSGNHKGCGQQDSCGEAFLLITNYLGVVQFHERIIIWILTIANLPKNTPKTNFKEFYNEKQENNWNDVAGFGKLCGTRGEN